MCLKIRQLYSSVVTVLILIFVQVEENAFRYFDVKASSHGQRRSRAMVASSGPYTGKIEEDAVMSPQQSELEGSALKRLSTVNGYTEEKYSVQSPERKRDSWEDMKSPPFTTSHGVQSAEKPYRYPSRESFDSIPAPFNLSRVVSFAGFDTSTAYDTGGKTDRQMNTLILRQSHEFMEYRLQRMFEMTKAIITKAVSTRSVL